MATKRGRKCKVKHERVVAYARRHPDMTTRAVGKHFGLSQGRISVILQTAGISRRTYAGRHPEPSSDQTSDQAYWEQKLHEAGLGMERGWRLGGRRILYAEDPLKEEQGDQSITQS